MSAPEDEARLLLALQDRLNDITTGYEFWRDAKVAAAELSTTDETFIRWMEHGE